MIFQFSKKQFDDIFCSLEYHVYQLLKRSCFEPSGDESTVFFEPKSWWKDDIYWLLESSCFELFGEGKCGLFLSQKVDRKMILIDCWKVLVFNFLEIGNTFFFELKSRWKDDIYWLLKSPCCELFGDGKDGLFWAKKLMERWYLLGFFELSMISKDLRNMAFRAVIKE